MASTRIEYMFDVMAMERLEPEPELARMLLDADIDDLDAPAARAWVAASQRLERFTEARRYQVAAHYADLHPPQPDIGPKPIGAEGTIAPGGDGTPTMGEFAITDLASPRTAPAGARGG